MKVEKFLPLVTPLLYLTIRGKALFDYLLPILSAIVVTVLFSMLPRYPAILGESGLLKGITDILAVLTGFFIAALAAVATFPNEILDTELVGQKTEVISRQRGNWIPIALTRRRFLLYLFGYLTQASFIIYCLGLAARLIGPTLAICFHKDTSLWTAKMGVTFVFSFLSANILFTSFYGLHYLVERMHRT